MLGGIISSAILSLIIIPILFEIMSKRELHAKKEENRDT
jgi:Cu/Ag efflux pump CusA